MSNAARERSPDELDAIFHALANRTRRAQLTLLARGPTSISELAKPFSMSLPAASKHLRVLENAGLVDRRVDGRVHLCSLEAAPLHDASDWLRTYRQFWNDTLDSFAAFVEDEPTDNAAPALGDDDHSSESESRDD